MIQEAIEQLKRGAVSGLANCHLPGIYSLVLKPRNDSHDGMLRVFYTTKNANLHRLEDLDDFKVMPHNHRQDITLYHLFGHATNIRMEFGYGSKLHEYSFSSALLNGEFAMSYRQPSSAVFIYEEIPEEGLCLRWDDVHTVIAHPESAWVVKEGDLAPEPYTSLSYSRQRNKTLKSEGLYRKMGAEELRMISSHILAHKGLQ